jgi:hypothetical protein
VAERAGFELPIPISEHPDDNLMWGVRDAQTKCRDRPRLNRLVGLYGGNIRRRLPPSCAMNDIATAVAAAIK